MDADLVAALGTAPTVTEKLYAEAIEDSRNQAAALAVERELRAQELQQYRADMKAMMEWFKAEYTKLPPETTGEADHLYQRCVLLGVETRKQSMSTATTQTTMLDVINDGIWIGEQLYAHLKGKLGQV